MSVNELLPALHELGPADKRFILQFLERELADLPDEAVEDVIVSPSLRLIDDLEQLEEDWDGEGAPIVTSQSIKGAKVLLKAIRQQVVSHYEWQSPDVSATPNGEVYLYWDALPLKVSAIVASESAAVLLVGSGQGRANRLEMNFADAATAIADLLRKRTLAESIK